MSADEAAALRAEVERLRRRVEELEAREPDEGEALRRLLEGVMDAMPGTVHVKDRDDRYEFVNRFFLESWGITREACLGKRPHEVFPEYGPIVAERDRRVLETRQALPFYEVEYPPRGGERVVVLSTKLPLLDPGGEVERILTIGLDVSSLKAAEEGQRRSEALMRAVVEASADAIVITDEQGCVLAFNPAAEGVFWIHRSTVLGRRLGDVGPEPERRPLSRSLERVLRDARPGRVERLELDLYRSDGTPFPAEATLACVAVETGLVGIATVRDLTERRAAERRYAEQQQALHQSEKMGALGSLLAGVAHELNNPLSVVLAQAVLMQETAREAATLARADRIHAAAERCARIVRSFLAIARQRPPEYAALRLADVVEAALDITGYGLRSSGIETVLDIDPGLPAVRGDADQLGQVFMNLIVNAQQALQEVEGPRRLGIGAALGADGRVRVEVTDNGPGVPPEIRGRIFDPFFTSKPVGTGTGVGLSVCMGIVAAHGGGLEHLDAPGGGARFRFSLAPAPTEAAAAPAPPEEIPAPAPARAILIVDDEPEIARMLAEILEPLARRIDVAENGLAALARLGETPYDVIISDLRMPELDGPGLYRRIRDQGAGLDARMIFVTGDTLHHNLEAFLRGSGVPVIEKPFHPKDVRRRVAEFLERAGGAA